MFRRNVLARVLAGLLLLTFAPVCAEPAAPSPASALAPLPMDLSCGPKPKAKCFLPEDGGYEDESLSIKIYKDRAYDTNILYAHIKITHPSQLRTAPASTFKHKGSHKAATIAARHHAVLAMNGDYFQFNSERFIVRQGKLIRNRPTGEDLLIIDSEGNFHVVQKAHKKDVAAARQAIADAGLSILNAFSFGPALVIDNEAVFPAQTNYFLTSALKPTQRAVIAQLGPLEYLIVSTEGPEDPGSRGLKLCEAADYTITAAQALGRPCLYAYNLDGGSSNSLILGGRKINSPNNPKSRAVSDIIYFATLVP